MENKGWKHKKVELKGAQNKIDLNKNGKLDAEDFKMLRSDKMETGGGVGELKWIKRGDMYFANGKNKYDIVKGLNSYTLNVNGKVKSKGGLKVMKALAIDLENNKMETGGTADSAMSTDPMIGGTMASSMAKGGNIESDIREKVNKFLNPLGYSARVESLVNEIQIEPDTRKVGNNRKDFFDGMQIIRFEDGTYEVSEYQAGENENELYIYKETKSLTSALNDLIKGNKRKPIKKYNKGGGVDDIKLKDVYEFIDSNNFMAPLRNGRNLITLRKNDIVKVTKLSADNKPDFVVINFEGDSILISKENLKDKNKFKKMESSKMAEGGGVEEGATIRIEETPYMASFSNLYGKDLVIKDIKNVYFASGPQKYFIVEVDGEEYEVPERFVKKYEEGGMMENGGGIDEKPIYIVTYAKLNERKVVGVKANSKEEALRQAEISRGYYGINNQWHAINVDILHKIN